MSELKAITSTFSHDIIAVNETWLNLNGRYLPAEVSIKGYVLHNVDKPSHSNRGGGSLIYVKEKLQPQIKTKRATEKLEILHLNIQLHPGQTIKILLMYRNLTCTAIEDDEFYDCLNNILSTPHETLIMGDFNLPHINWTTRQSQAPGSKLIDLMNTNSLQQHVNEPTRGNNILDLVMTTTDLSINGLEVTDKIGDHQMIDFSLEVQDPNSSTQHKQVFDYKRENFELMREELGNYNYEVLMNNKNAEESYMILKDKLATATDHHIPRKRIRATNSPPWFSQEIKRLINARQHSYRRFKRYQTKPHRQEHIYPYKTFKRTIKSTKRNKEITVAAQAKTNPKSFYKYVNDRRPKRDTIGPLIDSEGSTQTNNKIKAKILNTYFTSVFTHEDLTEIPQSHVLNTQEILSDSVFTVEEVEEQLSILNPYKSTGPEGLGPRILRECQSNKRTSNKHLQSIS
ncbi:Endonuclease/exonuclease/phosphatase [Trinorchestia longiramus]|nr:Endonuclease/exonuclease/phosphatase [Trinorchestia longiramus]